MKPYLVDTFHYNSTTEKNIEKIIQFFLHEEKSKQRTNFSLMTLNEKELKSLLIHIQVVLQSKRRTRLNTRIF